MMTSKIGGLAPLLLSAILFLGLALALTALQIPSQANNIHINPFVQGHQPLGWTNPLGIFPKPGG